MNLVRDFSVSTFTSTTVLSKSFSLADDGTLIKVPGGKLYEGTVETKSFESMSDFAAMLKELTPHNALAYGLCGQEKARVLTQDKLKTAAKGDLPLVVRTRDNFAYPAGPGILMLDVDVPKDGREPMRAEAVLEILYDVCPRLKESPHVIAASASSFIYQGDQPLRGRGGLRVFVLVADAQDIPRAGAVLSKKLGLAGHGRIEISKAGTMLVRGLIDDVVWHPERLDFAGGAHCEPPLEQRRPSPKVYRPDGSPLDTRQALPDLSLAEEADHQKLVEEAKRSMKPQAHKVRGKWVEEQVGRRLSAAGKSPESHPDDAKAMREVYAQAVDHQVLYGDFELICEDGATVTGGEVLDDPNKWHGRRFADPLEPEYGNDHRIARVNLRAAGRPHIYSHAHGGQRFKLVRARQEIRIVAGERVGIVQQALELMRLDGGIFERGGELVRVGRCGVIHPMRAQDVLFTLDRVARWMKFAKTPAPGAWVPADAPMPVAEGVLANRGHWNLSTLTATISAPTLDLKTMRLVEEEGFDQKSGLLLCMEDDCAWPGVITNPTPAQLCEAANTLWRPFREFPFCGPADRGVMLAAILTALVRGSLVTAPAFMFDAPSAGSGKTLLSKCIAILAGQSNPSVLVGVEKDEETRKRLLALGRSGASVAIIDNLSGVFASPALCGWLTSTSFTDRVLGVSEQMSVPTTALVILNGNNVTLKGDICRRVLTCRIDPAVDTPWRRSFDLDPASYCCAHRLELVAAGLTLLLAGVNKGKPPADRTASFELWSDTVRKTVLFVGAEGLLDVCDPTLAIDTAFEADPETQKLSTLLGAWYSVFGEKRVTVAELVSPLEEINEDHKTAATKAAVRAALAESLREIAADGPHGVINTRRLGHWLKKNKSRRIDNCRIETAGVRHKVGEWRCVLDFGDL